MKNFIDCLLKSSSTQKKYTENKRAVDVEYMYFVYHIIMNMNRISLSGFKLRF